MVPIYWTLMVRIIYLMALIWYAHHKWLISHSIIWRPLYNYDYSTTQTSPFISMSHYTFMLYSLFHLFLPHYTSLNADIKESNVDTLRAKNIEETPLSFYIMIYIYLSPLPTYMRWSLFVLIMTFLYVHSLRQRSY